MLYLSYNKQKNEVVLSFNGENFYEIYHYVKFHHFTYNPKNKTWSIPINKFYYLKEEVLDLDEIVKYDEKFDNLLKNYKIELETEFIHRPIKYNLFKLPPIKGIPPNEDYQLQDIKKGISQNRLLLAHEMGLGKLYILVNIINHLWSAKEIDKVLVVVPVEALYNWRREILRFSNLFKESDILISTATMNRDFLQYEAKIVILTYRHFLTVSDDYYKRQNPKKKGVKKYRNPPIPFDKWGTNRLIVLDESHHIKNYTNTRQTYVLHLHKHFFKYRYLASGTPDPNGVIGYYSQITFLEPNLLPDYYDWLGQVAEIGDRFSKYSIRKYKPDKVEQFVDFIKTWVIRRKTEECLKLPELYVKKIYVPLNKIQEKIYKLIIKDVFFKVEKNREDEKKKGNFKFNFMKRIINKFPFISLALDNPSILKENENREYIFNSELQSLISDFTIEKHSKIEVLDSLLSEHIKEQKEKVILWSGHPLTMNQLAEKYKKYNPIVIHGQIKSEKGMKIEAYREYLLDLFKNSNKHNLLIASYKVLSTSINLVEAHTAIYFDRSYDLKEWLQSIKRIHRIGQEKRVKILVLLIENTLDEYLDRLLEKKEDINNLLFDRESLTKEEWEKIFTGKEV